MRQYLHLCNRIVEEGRLKLDRTGNGRWSVFGHMMEFDLTQGFPLVTTKYVSLKDVFNEVRWMFGMGSTNNNDLEAMGSKFWRHWADEDGELGPVYGAQIRRFKGVLEVKQSDGSFFEEIVEVDQFDDVLQKLRNQPNSSRLVISMWNPAVLPIEGASHQENIRAGRAVLPACHMTLQFHVDNLNQAEILGEIRRVKNMELMPAKMWLDQQIPPVPFPHLERGEEDMDDAAWEKKLRRHNLEFMFQRQQVIHNVLAQHGIPSRRLSSLMFQRSADAPLGVPYNIAFYALLTQMVAQVTGMTVGKFIHVLGDAHIYDNQMETMQKEQIGRAPHPLPKVRLNPAIKQFEHFKWEDIELVGYQHHPPIKYEVSV